MNATDYRRRFRDIVEHAPGRHFMLDYGGDQACASIFTYAPLLRKLGVHRLPRVNNLVQLSALPEDEFLQRYDIGIRWFYPRPSHRDRDLAEQFSDAMNIDIEMELEKGYVSGGAGAWFRDEWGVTWKRSAYYFDQAEHPLSGKSFDEIRRYPFPDPTDPLRTENLAADLQRCLQENPNYVVSLSQSYGGILETALWVRGYADFYMDLASESPEGLWLLDFLTDYFLEFNLRYLAAVEGKVHVLAIGDDYGMQDRLLISPTLWRKHIKPRYARLLAAVKTLYPHIRVFHHSCGAIFPIIGDLAEIGIDILNPIQPAAKDMEPERLKRSFGGLLTFHGGIDVQQLLPFGTPEDIRAEVIRRLRILSADGGYIVAPSHNIQANTPLANVLAFYDAVKEFGAEHVQQDGQRQTDRIR